MYLDILLIIAGHILAAHQVQGNARLVCPAPQSADSSRTERKCLPFNPSGYTDLTPGPMTIRIEEVRAHSGSPMRLELLRGDSATPCLLLDHIPQSPTSQPGGNCQVRDYPVGQCTGSQYFVTINIPDVDCRECYLRLTYVNADEISGTDRQCTPSTCTTYYSCADVKIRGHHTMQEACPKTQGSWPYRPRHSFSADLRPEYEVPPVNTSQASGSATLVLRDNSLLYTISYGGISQFMAAHIHGPADNRTNADVQYTISEFTKPGGSDIAQGKWTNLTDTQIQDLKDGHYYINIHSGDFPNGEIRGQIWLTRSEFIPGQYVTELGDYNQDGWLSGQDFVGPSALASRFVVGFGQCVPDTKCFGTVVTNGNSLDVLGTAALQITSNRAWFGLDVANRPGEMSSIMIAQNSKYDSASIDLSAFRKTPGHAMGVLELTDNQLNALSKGGLQITVMFNGSAAVLTGNFEEGMIAMLSNEFEVPRTLKSPQSVGTAFARFVRSTSLLVDITVTGLTTTLTKTHIHGPGRQGQISDLLFDLSSDIHNLSQSDAHVKSSISNLLADHVRYLWENRLYFNVHTELAPDGELRNQICVPGKWQCSTDNINQCFASNLTVEQAVPAVELTNTAGNSLPWGLAGTKFDRLGIFYYSIALHNIDKSKVMAAHIHGPAAVGETAPPLITINHTFFTPKAGERDRVLEMSENVVLNDDQKAYARDGRLYFNIHTTQYPDGVIRGQLPRLQRSPCREPVQEFMITSSDGTQGFNPGHPYSDLHVLQGDRLLFRYPGDSGVYLLGNQAQYDGCVLINSNNIGKTGSGLDIMNITFTVNEAKTYYFTGNEEQCKADPPMKFRVVAVSRLASSELLSNDTCQSTSFATSTGNNQNTSGSGSSGSAVIAAAFIGLAVGAVIVAVIFVLNFRRAKSGKFDVKA